MLFTLFVLFTVLFQIAYHTITIQLFRKATGRKIPMAAHAVFLVGYFSTGLLFFLPLLAYFAWTVALAGVFTSAYVWNRSFLQEWAVFQTGFLLGLTGTDNVLVDATAAVGRPWPEFKAILAAEVKGDVEALSDLD